MGDENPIHTLGDYSKPSHEGYKNTSKLPDPNQHLKDFLKCPPLTWKPSLIVIMLVPTYTGNPQQMVVNFLAKDLMDSESNNPVYHSKIKHIEIRHHFIRDAYEKKPIQVLKVHTDDNVVDLLTKAFDGPRFNFLVVNIGMLNL
ncbi:hypothetical protein Tco_0332114 [Tanacetum coccineum]